MHDPTIPNQMTSTLQLVSEVDNLVIDSEFLAVVADDQDAHGTRSTTESLLQTRPEVTLVNDTETLLDLTSLGHGNKLTIITDIDQTVLLEDGTEQRVENDGRRWVGYHTRLLVKLLGEQVNTKIAVLACLGRGCDADDLAGAVLQDDEITNADVMARDGEGTRLARVY